MSAPVGVKHFVGDVDEPESHEPESQPPVKVLEFAGFENSEPSKESSDHASNEPIHDAEEDVTFLPNSYGAPPVDKASEDVSLATPPDATTDATEAAQPPESEPEAAEAETFFCESCQCVQLGVKVRLDNGTALPLCESCWRELSVSERFIIGATVREQIAARDRRRKAFGAAVLAIAGIVAAWLTVATLAG
jgi:hypothetical protein